MKEFSTKENENLIFLRENSKYYQHEIAAMLGISKANYCRWEKGVCLVPLKHLNKLANIFDSSMDYILGLTRKNNKTTHIDTLDYNIVAKNLKIVNKNSKLSLREFAKILNTSHSTLVAYEQGKTLIKTHFAYEIAKKYNISIDWLTGRSKNMFIIK